MANLLVSSAYLGTLQPGEGTDPLVTVVVAGPTARGPRLTLRVGPGTARLFRLTDFVIRLRIVVVLFIAAATLAAYFLTHNLAIAGATYFLATLVFIIEIFARLRGYPMILAGGKDVALLGFEGPAAYRWVEANPPGSIRFQPPDAPTLRLPLGRWGLVVGLYTLIALAITALVVRNPVPPALFTAVLALMVAEWLYIWVRWIRTPARSETDFLLTLPVLGDLVTGSTLRVFTLLPILIVADFALWML